MRARRKIFLTKIRLRVFNAMRGAGQDERGRFSCSLERVGLGTDGPDSLAWDPLMLIVDGRRRPDPVRLSWARIRFDGACANNLHGANKIPAGTDIPAYPVAELHSIVWVGRATVLPTLRDSRFLDFGRDTGRVDRLARNADLRCELSAHRRQLARPKSLFGPARGCQCPADWSPMGPSCRRHSPQRRRSCHVTVRRGGRRPRNARRRRTRQSKR